MIEGTARLYGASAKITYTNGYPVVVNHERQTAFAADVAREIAGPDKVDTDVAPVMGAEDFAFMLNERPGAFIFVGNGDSAGLHHPRLRFQRRDDPGRHVLLGAARGDGAGGAERLLRRFDVVGRNLRRLGHHFGDDLLRLRQQARRPWRR